MCLGGEPGYAPPPLTSLGLRLKLAFARKFHNSNFHAHKEEPINRKSQSGKSPERPKQTMCFLRAASASTRTPRPPHP